MIKEKLLRKYCAVILRSRIRVLVEGENMKVLWVCNIMLPAVAQQLGLSASHKEGWLTGLSNAILERGEENNIELGVAFPVGAGQESSSGEVQVLGRKLYYYGFQEDTVHPEQYDEAIEQELRGIAEDFQPDVIHCFGTEYPHTLAMSRVCPDKSRLLITIQGLCAVCAQAYLADIPEKECRKVTFRDWLKQDSMLQQQEKFCKRGEREAEAIRNAGNVSGRTQWDAYYTQKWNPKIRYFSMNETLRPDFYEGQWQEENCNPHQIFLSQGDYPLKGLHYMLLALPAICKKYPDACVKIAGNSLVENRTWKDKIKRSGYGSYLKKLIKQQGLEQKVEFLGSLNPQQMKQQYLNAGLYVCCSSLENSPNSLGEAMLLGVPCVSAEVGGIPSLFVDKEDGILYKGHELQSECYNNKCDQSTRSLDDVVKALSDAVIEMWESQEKRLNYSCNARKHARKTHDKEENYRKMMEIYAEIGREKE